MLPEIVDIQVIAGIGGLAQRQATGRPGQSGTTHRREEWKHGTSTWGHPPDLSRSFTRWKAEIRDGLEIPGVLVL
jgi:hypothetical protein